MHKNKKIEKSRTATYRAVSFAAPFFRSQTKDTLIISRPLRLYIMRMARLWFKRVFFTRIMYKKKRSKFGFFAIAQ